MNRRLRPSRSPAAAASRPRRAAHFLRRLAVLAVACLSWGAAGAASLYVIAHPDTAVTPTEVREIFLGERQFAGALRLVPVDNAAAQEAFLSRVMYMDAVKYASGWTKKSFRDGLNPPAVKGSDYEILEFVRRTPGAVGYTHSFPSGVRVIQQY